MNWVLALASAALLIFCFPGHNIEWLAPVALAPLMIAAARERNWRSRFLVGYTCGALYWFFTCSWIQSTIQTHGEMSSATAWFVFVLFSLAKALQTGVFTLLAGFAMRSRAAVPATAALWVLIEFTHGPMGFAWLNLGNAAIDMGWPLRLAPLTGVWGISFLFAACSAEIANLFLKRPGVPGFSVALWLSLGLLPALPIIEPREHAAMVQPNINEEENWTPQTFALVLTRLRELSLAHRGSLLIWPEAPAPFYDNDPVFMGYLADIARSANAFFLAGIVAHTPSGANLNSALLIDPDGKIASRYDKVNLVPFGEFVPWPLGPIAFRISNEAGGFVSGGKQVVSMSGSHRIGTFICYESAFPGFIRGFVRDGAQVLINPSNDGWFGKTAARDQHLEIVRMRAAENRRWILRDTNDGITAAIDPTGKVQQTLELYAEASGTMGFSYETSLTPYTQYGDWFVAFCGLVMSASYVELRARRRL